MWLTGNLLNLTAFPQYPTLEDLLHYLGHLHIHIPAPASSLLNNSRIKQRSLFGPNSPSPQRWSVLGFHNGLPTSGTQSKPVVIPTCHCSFTPLLAPSLSLSLFYQLWSKSIESLWEPVSEGRENLSSNRNGRLHEGDDGPEDPRH